MAIDLCQYSLRQLTDIRLSPQGPVRASADHQRLYGGANRRSGCLIGGLACAAACGAKEKG